MAHIKGVFLYLGIAQVLLLEPIVVICTNTYSIMRIHLIPTSDDHKKKKFLHQMIDWRTLNNIEYLSRIGVVRMVFAWRAFIKGQDVISTEWIGRWSLCHLVRVAAFHSFCQIYRQVTFVTLLKFPSFSFANLHIRINWTVASFESSLTPIYVKKKQQ